MKQTLIVVLAIVIISLSGASEDQRGLFYGEPHYILKVLTSDTVVDPGSNFRLQLYIVGGGNVDMSRIVVSIPEYIVNLGKVRITMLNFSIIGPNNTTILEASHSQMNKSEIMTILTTKEIIESDPNFYLIPPKFLYLIPGKEENGSIFYMAPLTYGEATTVINGTDYAPYTIDFAVAKNATAGDREILLDLTYNYGDKWYQDSRIIKLHINHWYETPRWQNILQLIAILGFILTTLLIIKEISPLLPKMNPKKHK